MGQEAHQAQDTNANCYASYVEFIAGVRSSVELKLARSFLYEFVTVDKGKVTEDNWGRAMQFAARIPKDGKPRELGDCLILAIADRLKHDVQTLDRRLRR
jgi:predicted nucleic acid-binding protein